MLCRTFAVWTMYVIPCRTATITYSLLCTFVYLRICTFSMLWKSAVCVCVTMVRYFSRLSYFTLEPLCFLFASACSSSVAICAWMNIFQRALRCGSGACGILSPMIIIIRLRAAQRHDVACGLEEMKEQPSAGNMEWVGVRTQCGSMRGSRRRRPRRCLHTRYVCLYYIYVMGLIE